MQTKDFARLRKAHSIFEVGQLRDSGGKVALQPRKPRKQKRFKSSQRTRRVEDKQVMSQADLGLLESAVSSRKSGPALLSSYFELSECGLQEAAFDCSINSINLRGSLQARPGGVESKGPKSAGECGGRLMQSCLQLLEAQPKRLIQDARARSGAGEEAENWRGESRFCLRAQAQARRDGQLGAAERGLRGERAEGGAEQKRKGDRENRRV